MRNISAIQFIDYQLRMQYPRKTRAYSYVSKLENLKTRILFETNHDRQALQENLDMLEITF